MTTRTVLEITLEDRPLKITESDRYGERTITVYTNQGKDGIVGDVPDVIGFPVAADDEASFTVDGEDDLRRSLIDCFFSAEAAAEISKRIFPTA
jgi:hypothetical protein